MEPLSQENLLAGAISPNDSLWRVVEKAMRRWAAPPKLTDETVRFYHCCKAIHKRASAKLLEAERTTKREHPWGVR